MFPMICVNHTLTCIYKKYNETPVRSNSTLCPKSDTDVAHYNFDVHRPFLIIFGRNVAEKVSYKTVYTFTTSPN